MPVGGSIPGDGGGLDLIAPTLPYVSYAAGFSRADPADVGALPVLTGTEPLWQWVAAQMPGYYVGSNLISNHLGYHVEQRTFGNIANLSKATRPDTDMARIGGEAGSRAFWVAKIDFEPPWTELQHGSGAATTLTFESPGIALSGTASNRRWAGVCFLDETGAVVAGGSVGGTDVSTGGDITVDLTPWLTSAHRLRAHFVGRINSGASAVLNVDVPESKLEFS